MLPKKPAVESGSRELFSLSGDIRQRLALVLEPAALMVLVFILDSVTLQKLILPNFAIRPREAAGLLGVLTSPFVHADVGHLTANLYGWLGVGTALSSFGVQQFLWTTVEITIAGHLAVWALATDGLYVGASGVIFGYSGFLLAVVWWERPLNLRSVAACAFVAVTYGFALLPLQVAGVSWISHMCGFLAGIASAYNFTRAGGNSMTNPECNHGYSML